VVVAERVEVVLGGHDLGVGQALRDLSERVALLGEQRPAPPAQSVREKCGVPVARQARMIAHRFAATKPGKSSASKDVS
jgi:hypothetical protein